MIIIKFTLIIVSVIFLSCSPTRKITKKNSYTRLKPELQKIYQQPVSTFDSKLDKLSLEISNSLNKSNKTVLAVIDFQDLYGRRSAFGKLIAEELITRIFRVDKFYVVERNLIDKLLNENKLSNSAIFNKETAIEIGKILGVEAIISGTLSELENTVRINARVISTESGLIFSTGNVTVNKDNSVKKLLHHYFPTNKNIEKLDNEDKLLKEYSSQNKSYNKSEYEVSTEFIYDWRVLIGIKKLGFNWKIRIKNDIGIRIDKYRVKLWQGTQRNNKSLKINKTYLLDTTHRLKPETMNYYCHLENKEVKNSASIIWGFIYEVTLIGTDDLGNKIEITNN